MQGLSDHALAKNQLLAQKLEHLAGTLVRVTIYHPYVSVYLRFTALEVEFLTEYEGDIDARLDLEASDILTALFVPNMLSHLDLEQCLYIPGRLDLSQFLVELCEKWDLWNLLATICSEVMPFLSHDSAIEREEFLLFRNRLEQRFQALTTQHELYLQEQKQHRLLLDSIQFQLRSMRLLFALLCVLVLLSVGFACWYFL